MINNRTINPYPVSLKVSDTTIDGRRRVYHTKSPFPLQSQKITKISCLSSSSWLPPCKNQLLVHEVRAWQWWNKCNHHNCCVGCPPGGGSRGHGWVGAGGGLLSTPSYPLIECYPDVMVQIILYHQQREKIIGTGFIRLILIFFFFLLILVLLP